MLRQAQGFFIIPIFLFFPKTIKSYNSNNFKIALVVKDGIFSKLSWPFTDSIVKLLPFLVFRNVIWRVLPKLSLLDIIQQQTLLKSFVNTPEANPYSVPLALFKTPSTSLKINMHSLWAKLARLLQNLESPSFSVTQSDFLCYIHFGISKPFINIYHALPWMALTFSYQIWLHLGVVTACIVYYDSQYRRCSSPIISALDLGSRDLGSRPSWISLFVSLGKTLYPLTA